MGHQPAQAEGGEPVNRASEIESPLGKLCAPVAVDILEPDADARHPDGPAAGILSAREGYALWAPHYDSEPNPLLALEQRTLAALLPPMAGKAAVDIGCGTGRWLEVLVQAGARPAVGVDLSSAMLRVAGAKPILCDHLVRADGRLLPMRSGVAEIIFVSFALRHIAELTAFAREIARVAKPGACCYVTDIHPIAYARGWRAGFRHPGGPAEIVTLAHSDTDIREAFRSQGFALIRVFEPCIGEPEKPIFARAQRLDRFAEVIDIPAILICCFQRIQLRDGTS